MLRVDPEKLEAQIAEMVGKLGPLANGTGAEAVVMRMQLALIPPLMRWKLSEMNGGETTDNEICNAFVAFVASQLAGMVADCVGGPPGTSEKHYALANLIIRGIGEELGAIFAGDTAIKSSHIMAEHTH